MDNLDNDKIIVEVAIAEGNYQKFVYYLVKGYSNALSFARLVEKNSIGTVCFRCPEEFGNDLSFADPWGRLKY